MTAKNTAKILDLATQMGLDALAVACPLCQMNLDLRQKQALKEAKSFFNMPVLYFTQFMGLAFGYRGDQLALDKLRVSADGLIAKMEAARAAAKPADTTGDSAGGEA